MNSSKTPVARDFEPIGWTTVVLALLTSVLWGGTPVAIRYSVDSIPPLAVAALRFALGALFMVVWCRFAGTNLRLRSGQWLWTLGGGVFLFAQISLFNIGVQLSNASHGSMMINTFIFAVVAIDHFVTKADRLSTRKLIGLLLAALSVGLVLSLTNYSDKTAGVDAPSIAGDLILLVSSLLLAVKIIYTKHVIRFVEPGKFVFWHHVFGVVLFAATSLLVEDWSPSDVGTSAILGIAYQGILVAGLCFAIQALLLRRHSASQVSVFSFSTPLFGVGLAVLLRGDRLSPWLLVAAVGVAAGIFLVSTPRSGVIQKDDSEPSEASQSSAATDKS